MKQIAQTTAGFTGADLENLLNEAAIVAAKENRSYIIQKDIKESFLKVGVGPEKKSRIITEKEKKITAYHESGHAILFHVLPDVGPVYTVSISQPVVEQQAIRCHCRSVMKCLIPREECCSR